MHINTGYQRDGAAADPALRGHLRAARGDRRAVRDRASARSPTSTRWSPGGTVTSSWRSGPSAVAARTYELSQLLIDVLHVEDVGAHYPHRVTYHPTCHSLRLLRVGDRPLRLLRHVSGLELVPLPDAEVCCGFGGTFAVKNADTSTAMLADKMRNVLDTGAEVCTAGDSSCLMHIGGGLSRLRAGVQDRAPRARSWRPPDEHLPWAAGSAARRRAPAAERAVPGGGAARASRHPAAPQPRQSDLAPSGPSAARWSASCRTGRSCARPARPSRSARWPASAAISSSSRSR